MDAETHRRTPLTGGGDRQRQRSQRVSRVAVSKIEENSWALNRSWISFGSKDMKRWREGPTNKAHDMSIRWSKKRKKKNNCWLAISTLVDKLLQAEYCTLLVFPFRMNDISLKIRPSAPFYTESALKKLQYTTTFHSSSGFTASRSWDSADDQSVSVSFNVGE